MKINKSKVIKELKEWVIFLSVLLILYFTGLYTEIAGGLQRLVLATGLRNATIETTNYGNADFTFTLQTLDTQPEVIPFEKWKGKVIFLNFWATWCPPCIAEMPSIQALYDKIEDKENIAFVMLATNDEKEKVQKFIKRKAYTFPIYFLGNSYLPPVFHSQAIPTTFIVNPAGKIVFKHEGIANYDTEEFEKMLEGLIK